MEPPFPKPLQELKWMEGSWSGAMTSQMGGPAKTEIGMEAVREGQFYRLTFTNQTDGATVRETAFLGWDAKSKMYKMWTFGSMSESPRVEAGQLNGGALLMTSEPWIVMGQDGIVFRSTLKPGKEGIEFVLELKQGDAFIEAGRAMLRKRPGRTPQELAG